MCIDHVTLASLPSPNTRHIPIGVWFYTHIRSSEVITVQTTPWVNWQMTLELTHAFFAIAHVRSILNSTAVWKNVQDSHAAWHIMLLGGTQYIIQRVDKHTAHLIWLQQKLTGFRKSSTSNACSQRTDSEKLSPFTSCMVEKVLWCILITSVTWLIHNGIPTKCTKLFHRYFRTSCWIFLHVAICMGPSSGN
jgi:hypothetical protein